MSRYDIPAVQPHLSVAVGWDRPLSTFFAQVVDTAKAEDARGRILLWIGTAARECPTPDDLVAPLARFATVPAAILAALRADRVADLDRGPTPLQRRLGR